MSTATVFHGLYQGEHDTVDDATLVGVFSTEVKAARFEKLLSDKHTELKREANDRRAAGLETDDVPDLYWDVRPVTFDPRSLEELL